MTISLQRPWVARIRSFVVCLTVMCFVATHTTNTFAQSPAAEATSTAEIFSATVAALPSCVQWKPKGLCFWLVCTWFSCTVKTTLRIEHFTPDVTISTWHDKTTHPWKDYGRVLAEKLEKPGRKMFSAFSGIGGASAAIFGLDSGGTKTQTNRDSNNFHYRGVDAIGNPVNFVSGMLTGDFGTANSPTSIAIPSVYELSKFFQSFPSQVAAQWATVPSTYTTGQTSFASSQSTGAMGSIGLTSSNGVSMANTTSLNYYTATNDSLDSNGQLSVTGTGGGGQGNGNGGVATGGSDYFCPPGISPFGLAFQSDLDSPFWRNVWPLELIFPASWLPGMREVGQGLLQTWGNVWPRQGTIYQQHPVKASAVLAQRAGDIISYGAQPHIYAPLQLDTNSNYKFFGFQGIKEHDANHTVWQRVFPSPQQQCQIFGYNDAISLIGFGDGHNTSQRGMVWNAWRKQDCCKKATGGAAVFLFSVP